MTKRWNSMLAALIILAVLREGSSQLLLMNVEVCAGQAGDLHCGLFTPVAITRMMEIHSFVVRLTSDAEGMEQVQPELQYDACKAVPTECELYFLGQEGYDANQIPTRVQQFAADILERCNHNVNCIVEAPHWDEVNSTLTSCPGLTNLVIKELVIKLQCVPNCPPNRVLTAPSGIITSPNFPYDYQSGGACTWTIAVEPGQRVRLSLDRFSLPPKTTKLQEGSSCEDYVTISGAGSKWKGQLCGNLDGSVLYSQGNTMVVHFQTQVWPWPSYHTGMSFHFTYTSFEPSTCGQTSTAPSGIIISPNFPDTFNGVDCTWNIRVSKEERIKLDFTMFNLGLSSKDTAGCPRNYLQIEGALPNNYIRPGGEYCGSIQGSIYSASNSLTIKLTSIDSHYVQSKFQLNYTSINVTEELPRLDIQETLTPPPVWTQSTVTADFGYCAEETASLSCSQLFLDPTLQDGQMMLRHVEILLTADDGFPSNSELETCNDVNTDCAVSLFGQDTQTRDKIPKVLLEVIDDLWRTCGNRTSCSFRVPSLSAMGVALPHFCSEESNLRVKQIIISIECFTSDQPLTEESMITVVSPKPTSSPLPVAAAPRNPNSCGGRLTGRSGKIDSPSFKYYSADCFWEIVVDEDKRIEVHLLYIPKFAEGLCITNFVEIYDFVDGQTAEVSQYCDMSTEPILIQSTSHRMLLRFRTERPASGDIFHFSYTRFWAKPRGGQ